MYVFCANIIGDYVVEVEFSPSLDLFHLPAVEIGAYGR